MWSLIPHYLSPLSQSLSARLVPLGLQLVILLLENCTKAENQSYLGLITVWNKGHNLVI